MQFSILAVAALAAGLASAAGNGTVQYTTEVHTIYTTYCPESTTFSLNGVTYTVSTATTLTITDCPCTVTKPVYTSSSVICNSCSTPAPVPYQNNTATSTKSAIGTTSTTKAAASSTAFTGAGSKAFAASGAGLAGLLGLAAYVL